MLVGTALYICLLVYVGLSLFILSGLYVYMVVCIVYAYNLTFGYTCYCSDGFHGVRCEGMFRLGPETTTASPSTTPRNLGKNLLVFFQKLLTGNFKENKHYTRI